MASGAYTGYQHQLMDMDSLTKEDFIKFCDDAFYHLSHFGYSLEEAKERAEKRRLEVESNLAKAKAELNELIARSDDEWEQNYHQYATKVIEGNRRRREVHNKEMIRWKQIDEYVTLMRGHLDYIWEGLQVPELYHEDITDFDTFKRISIDGARRDISFHESQLEDSYSLENQKNVAIRKQYEAKRKAFLEG